MDLTDLIYEYTKDLPNNEKYILTDQINRSSISIPSNIAEGSGKPSQKEFSHFLSSAYELETQLLICEKRKYGNAHNVCKFSFRNSKNDICI